MKKKTVPTKKKTAVAKGNPAAAKKKAAPVKGKPTAAKKTAPTRSAPVATRRKTVLAGKKTTAAEEAMIAAIIAPVAGDTAPAKTEHLETPGEEIANSLTHGIGALLSAAALSVLVTLAALKGDAWRVVSFSIYGVCMVLLYTASTFYHAFQGPRVKRLFRIFDHSAIYLLIAGSYTPFTLVSVRGGWGWSIFGIIWGLALGGIIFKSLFLERYEVVSTIVYVAMGWLAVVAAKPLLLAIPPGGIAWIVAGGISYTGGVVFYAWDRLPFNHAIWHLFVLGGSACHFMAILLYVLPIVP